ncbi:MAG: hypothetical protein JWM51_93 [Microbacteriaceae bacterium]|jgi:hypothetical protein|nr:hypothetical protein [Microbacteriaceae bacterium]
MMVRNRSGVVLLTGVERRRSIGAGLAIDPLRTAGTSPSIASVRTTIAWDANEARMIQSR